jgi:hypothetical protein
MRASAVLFAVAVLLGGCSSSRDATSAETSASPGSTSVQTPPATAPPPAQNGQQPPPDVVPEHAIRAVRAIEERYSEPAPRLADGIRAVSGIESTVRCWTKPGWKRLEKIMHRGLSGLADVGTYEIHLHPFACQGVEYLLAGNRPETGDAALFVADGLVVLTHEGTHFTSAGSNEAVVECRAMQNAHLVAARLGIDEDYARRLAALYWERAYPRGDPVYGSSECRDGGTMDVHPETSDWP